MPRGCDMVPANRGIGADGWAHSDHTAPVGTDPVPLYHNGLPLSSDKIVTTKPRGSEYRVLQW